MQIFVLDEDPALAAKYHCDRHVVKMILETCQLLCTAYYEKSTLVPPYKRTHMNHPCAVWCRKTKGNYEWLLQLGFSLSDEYTIRYGKIHKSLSVLKWLEANKGMLCSFSGDITPFAQAMPDEYRVHMDAVTAYRKFYIGEKSSFATWKNREVPAWFK